MLNDSKLSLSCTNTEAEHKKKVAKETLNRTAVRLIRNSYMKLFHSFFPIYSYSVNFLIFSISVWWFWHSFVSQIKAFYGKNVANPCTVYTNLQSELVAVRYQERMIIFMLCFPFRFTLFFRSLFSTGINSNEIVCGRQTNCSSKQITVSFFCLLYSLIWNFWLQSVGALGWVFVSPFLFISLSQSLSRSSCFSKESCSYLKFIVTMPIYSIFHELWRLFIV